MSVRAGGKPKSPKPWRLTSSQEDYLEAILALIGEAGVARVRDIANRLEVGKPAVTAALKTLSKRGLVNYDPYQLITLTELGKQAGQRVQGRHDTLKQFLINVLGLDADTAEANACRMEHSADDVTLERLHCLAEFLETSPASGGKKWLAKFEKFRAKWSARES